MPVRPNQYRGVTLTELMVTLAVIAILTVVAAPGFSEYIQKSRVRGAGEALTDLLSQARSEAIKRDRQVAVTLGGSVASWCAGARSAVDPPAGGMAGPATACDCSSATSCLIGTDRTVVDGSEFRGVNISAVGGTVTFDGKLGTLTNLTPTAITLSGPNARFQLRVAVGATGLSSICVPTGAGFISGIPSCP